MKLTKELLKRIIKEELEATLKEMDRNDDYQAAALSALEAVKAAGLKDERQIAMAIIQQLDKEGVTSSIGDMEASEIMMLAEKVLGSKPTDLGDFVKLYSDNPSLVDAVKAAMAAKKAGIKEPQAIAQAILSNKTSGDLQFIIDYLATELENALGDKVLAQAVADLIEG